MSLLASPAMTDDCVQVADRTSARQLRQTDLGYPGSALSSVHDNAIKRITTGVKAPPVTGLCQRFRSAGRAFTLRLNQFRTKKEYNFALAARQPLNLEHWPVIADDPDRIAGTLW